MEKQEFVVINGPMAVLPHADWSRLSQIVYSIQLANGLIVTSPEAFPPAPENRGVAETDPPRSRTPDEVPEAA